MQALLTHLPELAMAELAPDGAASRPDLDLDLDVQDVELYAPASDLEIALPGRW